MGPPSLFAKNVSKTGTRNLRQFPYVVIQGNHSWLILIGGELTGDTDGGDGSVLRDNDIIITTPEKWDAVTRKKKDFSRFTDLIRLLLVWILSHGLG